MAYCTNCGKEIPDGVKFCSECGAQTNYSQKAVYENGSYVESNPVEIKQDTKQKKIFTILGVVSFIIPFLSFFNRKSGSNYYWMGFSNHISTSSAYKEM